MAQVTRRPSPARPGRRAGIAAVRGAIAVAADTRDQVLASTARLLRALVEANALEPDRIVSALFTATEDLTADFPAHAARRLGWSDVPLLCAREIAVPGALPRVVRVLLTVSGVEPGQRLVPVYLDGAEVLRPELAPDPDPSPAAPRPPERRVALIGLGQIGGSIGLGLGGRGWRRVGFDRDPGALAAARKAGAIDEAAGSLESACAGCHLAVLAIPVPAIPAAIRRAARALPRGAALIDTGSTRGPIVAALERAAARGIRALGAHPLAGNERRGLAGADAALFAGASWVWIPVAGEIPAVAAALARDLGARTLTVSAADHDRALARTSHLPYLFACALRAEGAADARAGLTGPAFRDLTRVAGSDPRVAMSYCRANAVEIARAWRSLRARLDRKVRELPGSRRAPRTRGRG